MKTTDPVECWKKISTLWNSSTKLFFTLLPPTSVTLGPQSLALTTMAQNCSGRRRREAPPDDDGHEEGEERRRRPLRLPLPVGGGGGGGEAELANEAVIDRGGGVSLSLSLQRCCCSCSCGRSRCLSGVPISSGDDGGGALLL